jgi:hypothetical protein
MSSATRWSQLRPSPLARPRPRSLDSSEDALFIPLRRRRRRDCGCLGCDGIPAQHGIYPSLAATDRLCGSLGNTPLWFRRGCRRPPASAFPRATVPEEQRSQPLRRRRRRDCGCPGCDGIPAQHGIYPSLAATDRLCGSLGNTPLWCRRGRRRPPASAFPGRPFPRNKEATVLTTKRRTHVRRLYVSLERTADRRSAPLPVVDLGPGGQLRTHAVGHGGGTRRIVHGQCSSFSRVPPHRDPPASVALCGLRRGRGDAL